MPLKRAGGGDAFKKAHANGDYDGTYVQTAMWINGLVRYRNKLIHGLVELLVDDEWAGEARDYLMTESDLDDDMRTRIAEFRKIAEE